MQYLLRLGNRILKYSTYIWEHGLKISWSTLIISKNYSRIIKLKWDDNNFNEPDDNIVYGHSLLHENYWGP